MLKCHQELLETGFRTSSPSDTSPRLTSHLGFPQQKQEGGLEHHTQCRDFQETSVNSTSSNTTAALTWAQHPPWVLVDKERYSVHRLPWCHCLSYLGNTQYIPFSS